MSRHYDDDDTDDIEVSAYDPKYDKNLSGQGSGSGQHMNYYQRMQQEMRNGGAAKNGAYGNGQYSQNGACGNGQYSQNGAYGNGQYGRNSAYGSGYDDRFTDDDDDDDYDIGDTYDFGRSSGKKKKKRRDDNDRCRNGRDDRYDDGRRSRLDDYDDRYDDRRRSRRDDYDDDDRDYRRKKKKKRHPVRRFFLTLLIILLILGGIIAFLLHSLYSHLNRVDPVADTTADTATEAAGVTPYSENGVMNILLIGTDERSDSTDTTSRSDSMIICSLNRKTGKITMVSLMRDMYVEIAGGYGTERLNTAYAYGGLETLDETVQEDFGIDINGNAVVDFEGFLEALTAVGNLNLTLSQEEADYLNTYPGLGSADDVVEGVTWNLQAGENEMTPEQVLAYSRMRYVGNSDWDRTTRQRNVIQAALSKIKSQPFLFFSVAGKAAPSITTDMTDAYLTKAIFYAILCGTDMNSYLIPSEGQYTAMTTDAGAAVLVPDLDVCHQALISYLYDSSASDAEQTTGTADNGTTDNGTDYGTTDNGTDYGAIDYGTTDTETTTDTGTDGTDAGQTDDSVIDPTTGQPWTDLDGDGVPDVDMDHDGIPDSWGDTW